jgi:hypothetical protein
MTSPASNQTCGSETEPVYRKVAHDEGGATRLWFIVVDEGWREGILCERMYEWAADWLLTVLERRPYAPVRKVGRRTLKPGLLHRG